MAQLLRINNTLDFFKHLRAIIKLYIG